MRGARWNRAGAAVLAVQAAYNGLFAIGPLSLLFMPADPSIDRTSLVGEFVPMVAVAAISAVFAVLTWRVRSRSLIAVVAALAGIQSLLGLGWVAIGFFWGGPFLAAFYAIMPVPGPAVLGWVALACFVTAWRRWPPDQPAAIAGEEGRSG